MPHEHHIATKVTVIEYNTEYDWLTLLKHAISADLGENHLEKYASKECKIKVNPAILQDIVFQIAPCDYSLFFEPAVDRPAFLKQHNIYKNLHLRAPPVV